MCEVPLEVLGTDDNPVTILSEVANRFKREIFL